MGGVSKKTVIIIGGGPAGLMAAEILGAAGCKVHLYDRKPSVARKFLMAGRGGLNLTHSEDMTHFLSRYGVAENWVSAMIHDFTPQHLRDWCEGLGQKTFVGSSGRVFPEAMKASPLLRIWLARLENYGVEFHLQRTWAGWDQDGACLFNGPDGNVETASADAVLLALGGASWPGLGSDGAWVTLLQEKGIEVSPLRSANSGFVCRWSEIFRKKFAGQPLKGVALICGDHAVQGEAMISANGLEGGVVYAVSSHIRSMIERDGKAIVHLDLKPALSIDGIVRKLDKERGKQSFSTYLQKNLSLSPLAINLLREVQCNVQQLSALELAQLIKLLPLTFTEAFSIDRAISSAGGIALHELDDDLQLRKMKKVFAAGEMIDWDAPTGGYLLQACFATGQRAAKGILKQIVP